MKYYIHAIKDGIQVNQSAAGAFLSFKASDEAAQNHGLLMSEARRAIAFDVYENSDNANVSTDDVIQSYPLPVAIARAVLVEVNAIQRHDKSPTFSDCYSAPLPYRPS